MGLEPTNLLTASQALYQLSYAPAVADVTSLVPLVREYREHPSGSVESGDGAGLRRAGDREQVAPALG